MSLIPIGTEQNIGPKPFIHIHSEIQIAGFSETLVSSHEDTWSRIQENRILRRTSHIKLLPKYSNVPTERNYLIILLKD
jgi:hypothetical protein